MPNKLIQITIFVGMLLITACSDNSAQATLVADNALLGTQIVELRVTATYLVDEIQRTAEYVMTEVPKVARLRDELSSTLQAAGLDAGSINQVQPNTAFAVATAPAAGQPNVPVGPPPTNSTPGSLDLNLNAPAVGTPTSGSPALFNLVTAEGVGSNDCAISSVTTFTPDTAQIYVVATASNIAAGSLIAAQWYMDSTLVTEQSFAPDSNINDNCIWFFAEQVDFPFTPGNYRVDLTVDGAALASASFAILAPQ